MLPKSDRPGTLSPGKRASLVSCARTARTDAEQAAQQEHCLEHSCSWGQNFKAKHTAQTYKQERKALICHALHPEKGTREQNLTSHSSNTSLHPSLLFLFKQLNLCAFAMAPHNIQQTVLKLYMWCRNLRRLTVTIFSPFCPKRKGLWQISSSRGLLICMTLHSPCYTLLHHQYVCLKHHQNLCNNT